MNVWQRSVLASCLLAVAVPLAANAGQLATPSLGSFVQGQAKIVVRVQAGGTGAPAGFHLQWMKQSDFVANGNQFYGMANAAQCEGVFTGTPTLNTWGGTLTTFTLGPSSAAAVEIGDLFDETGVSTNESARIELAETTPYVFRARANATATELASAWSYVLVVDTGVNVNCTYTQGYWKNHPEAWPVDSLTLGTVTYTKSQLLMILGRPARGNGLIILAHQLIPTLLNIAMGADPADVNSTIDAAQLLIGSRVVPPIGTGYLDPSSTSSLAQTLDDYNNGIIGPGHCDSVGVEPTSWSSVKGLYR